MFGYVSIDKTKLSEGEQGLSQTFMCGLCMSTKKHFSNKSRLAIGYDVNFFNVLLHSVQNVDVTVENKRCFSHPFTKRTILAETDLTERIAIANVMLVTLDLYDDVVDGASFKKKFAYNAFQKDYQKARELWPEMDEMLTNSYNLLREKEQSGCNVIDEACHPFALLTEKFAELVTGESNQFVKDLCYNAGKWIYLIDALDDVGKDLKKGNYNPFVAHYSLQKESDTATHLSEISFEMYAVLNRLTQCYNDLSLTKYKCILDNVIYYSMRQKTQQVLEKYKSVNNE